MEPQLLYICGAAHSGSTLLDVCLGRHPDISSVGEVAVLNQYIESIEGICACRKSARQCEFWQTVLQEFSNKIDGGTEKLNTNFHNDPENASIELSNLYRWDMRRREAITPTLKLQMALSIAYLLMRGSGKGGRQLRKIAPQIMQRASYVHGLFDSIRTVSGCPIILDSSKHAYRYRLLLADRPEQARCIFLVRDGRARMHSQMRREGVDARTAAQQWKNENRHALQFLRSIPDSHRLDVTYESICRDTSNTLQNIYRFAGLPAESSNDAENIDKRIHNIGGNRARFNGYETIREDTKWRTECHAEDLAVFERIAGGLNRRLLGSHYHD